MAARAPLILDAALPATRDQRIVSAITLSSGDVKAIRNVLEDDKPSRHIARQGRQAYNKNFTEKKVVTQYMDFFESVLGAAGGTDGGGEQKTGGETDKKTDQGAP